MGEFETLGKVFITPFSLSYKPGLGRDTQSLKRTLMAASSAPPAAQNPLKTLRNASFPRPCRLRIVSPARPPPISALASSPSTAAASPLSADARHRDDVLRAARAALSNCLSETYLDRTVPGLSSKARGKVGCSASVLPPFLFLLFLFSCTIIDRLLQVRDIYDAEDHLVLVTTDRQSAFDRVLASIPFKGQVFLLVSINSDVLDNGEYHFFVVSLVLDSMADN